jgi:DegV family protein with EDD domain
MSVGIIVDSSCDLDPEFARQRGVVVVPLHIMLPHLAAHDDTEFRRDLYDKLDQAAVIPTYAGVPNRVFAQVFAEALQEFDELLCLSMTFWDYKIGGQARGASGRFPGQKVKVLEAGRGFAALAALALTLSEQAGKGASRAELEAYIDEYSMDADCLMAPASVAWLDRAKRLSLMESKLGQLGGRLPILRAHTQLSPVSAVAEAEVVGALVEMASRAANGKPVRLVIGDAEARDRGDAIAERARWMMNVTEIVRVGIGPVAGAYLGRGAVSLGWCPTPATRGLPEFPT